MVRGPDWLAAWLSKDESYLFAYSAYVRNPRFRKEMLVDTNGPQLVDNPGLEPALFLDAPGLRNSLLHAFDQDTLHSERFLADVIAGLRSADTQLQNFYAVELSLLAELAQRKDPALVQVKSRCWTIPMVMHRRVPLCCAWRRMTRCTRAPIWPTPCSGCSRKPP